MATGGVKRHSHTHVHRRVRTSCEKANRFCTTVTTVFGAKKRQPRERIVGGGREETTS